MGSNNRENLRRILALALCVLVSAACMSFPAYAVDEETDGGSAEVIELVEAVEIQTVSGGEQEDADALLEGYMDSRIKEELSGAKRKASETKRRETLNDNEKIIYDGIKAFVDRVAAGDEATAVTTIDVSEIFRPYLVQELGYNAVTSESLGISSAVYVGRMINGKIYWSFSNEAKEKLYAFEKVYSALLADEPYAFYWHDKTKGVMGGLNVMTYVDTNTSDIFFTGSPTLSLSFSVSADYAGSGAYGINTSRTAATSAAVTAAAGIITANASKPDLEKLTAYKDTICELTEYDFDAASDINYPYGDPWQMIYVFDGDDETNVVCEGYSKAFQYLCDNTEFFTDIECDSVTGIFGYYDGEDLLEDLHMWNILHMDDGSNYMADITNSDNGGVGVFIAAASSGSVDEGYWYNVNGDSYDDFRYVYDSDTLGIFSEDELTMSEFGYVTPEHNIPNAVYTWSDDCKRCTATGTCSDCGETFTSEAVVTSAVKTAATCTKKGVTKYTARFGSRGFRTQRKEKEDIPLADHSWGSGTVTKAATEDATGIRTYTCSVCRRTKTESIPVIVLPTDLPSVKIVKPSAAKKKFTAKWKKPSKKNLKKIQGIEVQVKGPNGYYKTFTVGKSKTSKTITKLKSKKKYSVRVRAYKWKGGVKHVSKWTKWKTIKVK